MSAPTMLALPDGMRLRTWTTGVAAADRLPVLLVHGGPGVPDYLEPVAGILDDTWLVHRYDQRGVGGSPWDGDHTVEQVVTDAVGLMDQWGHEKVTLVGHSFGTNLACYIALRQPDRVGGLVLLAGPFLGPRWREGQRLAEEARRTATQQMRLDRLNAQEHLSDDEEIERLTLSWFTDHADPARAWRWAAESARTSRPINYTMNRQLNAAKRATPLEDRLTDLRALVPGGTVLIGGAEDSRPQAELREVSEQLDAELVIIPNAGHDPWLEQPMVFRDALRAAVDKQDQTAAHQTGGRFTSAGKGSPDLDSPYRPAEGPVRVRGRARRAE